MSLYLNYVTSKVRWTGFWCRFIASMLIPGFTNVLYFMDLLHCLVLFHGNMKEDWMSICCMADLLVTNSKFLSGNALAHAAALSWPFKWCLSCTSGCGEPLIGYFQVTPRICRGLYVYRSPGVIKSFLILSMNISFPR